MITFLLEPPDEPYFRDLHWLRGVFWYWVIDIALRKSNGRGFRLMQDGRVIAGFVAARSAA
jgi:hypothetical protein